MIWVTWKTQPRQWIDTPQGMGDGYYVNKGPEVVHEGRVTGYVVLETQVHAVIVKGTDLVSVDINELTVVHDAVPPRRTKRS